MSNSPAPASLAPQPVLPRTGSGVADQYCLVRICGWKPDGSCSRSGPCLVRQLERVAAELAHSGKYTRITAEAARFASRD